MARGARRWGWLLVALAALPATAEDHVVASVPVTDASGQVLDTLQLPAGTEAVDAAFEFVQKHDLDSELTERLRTALCQQGADVLCTRDRPRLFHAAVPLAEPAGDGALSEEVELEVLQGQQLVDVLAALEQSRGLRPGFHRTRAVQLCESSAVPPSLRPAICSRRRLVVHRVPVQGGGGGLLGELEVEEDEVVADSVYRFGERHHLDAGTRMQLRTHICSTTALPCDRHHALLVNATVPHPTGAIPLPTNLVVWEGEEPADAVAAWCTSHDLDDADRDNLIAQLCDEPDRWAAGHGLAPRCRRRSPVLFQQSLTDENGANLGLFTLMADEEVADAAYAFAARNGLGPGFRQSLMATFCERPKVLCSRQRAKVASKRVGNPEGTGSYPGMLEIWEDEEPIDAIAAFANNHSMPVASRQALLFTLCNDRTLGLQCSRAVPAHFSLDMIDETGKSHGALHVLEGDRPIDALHAWMKDKDLAQSLRHPHLRHRLFWRLCGAAADAGVDLDCSITTPRPVIVEIELTYNGMKTSFPYYAPDEHSVCTPRPPEIPAVDDFENETGCFSWTRSAVHFFCARLSPMPNNCLRDIHEALLSKLQSENDTRWEKAGPVGVDFYQLLRLPRDANNQSVVDAINRTAQEVIGLHLDVATQAERAIKAFDEGATSLIEASSSIDAMNATLDTARTLLQSAALNLEAVRNSLGTSRLTGQAADATLRASRQVGEGLRTRLLQLCNHTIVARNCTRIHNATRKGLTFNHLADATSGLRRRQGEWEWRVCLQYGENYTEAARGCALLERNETWVCPAARERLESLLPRYPVDTALNASRYAIRSWTVLLGQTMTQVEAVGAAVAAAQAMVSSSRVSRAIAHAALSVAGLNLKLSNRTAEQLKDPMEQAVHRSWALKQAKSELTDARNREFYDKPCRTVFGACCARDQADGGMSILCG